MNSLRIGLMSAALVAGLATASAQTVAADSVMQHVNGKRLSVGGYGEVAMSRNFYSDAGKRYSNATAYKNAPDHGRFDIPHAVSTWVTISERDGPWVLRLSLNTEVPDSLSNTRLRKPSSMNRR